MVSRSDRLRADWAVVRLFEIGLVGAGDRELSIIKGNSPVFVRVTVFVIPGEPKLKAVGFRPTLDDGYIFVTNASELPPLPQLPLQASAIWFSWGKSVESVVPVRYAFPKPSTAMREFLMREPPFSSPLPPR